MGSISSKNIMRIMLYGVGITSLSSLVYLAGPLVAIGGYRPLEVPMTQMIQAGTFYHTSGDVYEQVPGEGMERAAGNRPGRAGESVCRRRQAPRTAHGSPDPHAR